MSENSDDLEQTLMVAAAAADSRRYSNENVEPSSSEQSIKEGIHYYTKTKTAEKTRPEAEESDGSSYPKIVIPNREHSSSNIDNSLHKDKKRKYNQTFESQNEANNKKSKDVHTEKPSGSSHAQVVATHYNLIEEKGLQERSKSRIVYLRTFHNWIKSMLINEYLTKIKDFKKQHNPPIRVHDMCCGKGGDLYKWKIGNISHLICSDIAEISLDHCKTRYEDMKQRSHHGRGRGSGTLFSIEVLHADMCKSRIREKYADPSIKLDLVSCQFAVHYGFESLPQAETMIKNAAECLQPGGYFIGTMTDANEIVARARKAENGSFGNEVLHVSVDFDIPKPPFFGAKYNFELDEVVKCPEFLVHFPTFVKLAKKYGLKLVRKEKFHDFFERVKDEGKQLLSNMGALESYPPSYTATLVGSAFDDYNHAKDFIERNCRDQMKIGTLSKSEWEASSLYLTFAFEKVKNTWNPDGTPCYEI